MALWDSFKRFGKKQDNEQPPANSDFPELPRRSAADNPWNVPLLEVHPVTQQMLSTTRNPLFASNAVSYSQDDGTGFIGMKPPSARVIPADLRYRIDGTLADGALFLPNVMEHKWALYYHQRQILFIRSWQRLVQVVADVEITGNEARISAVRGTFMQEDEPAELTLRILDFLLRSHALDLVYPAPIPSDMASDAKAAALWCMSTYGSLAVFAASDPIEFTMPEPLLRTYSLLHIAAARANMQMVSRLLAQGLPIDLPDKDGQSPLHWALSTDDLSAATYLLEHGAQIDFRDPEGATVLMQMTQRNAKAKVDFLLARGADANAGDARGFTSLHRAAEMGNGELVELLLQRGASPNPEAAGHTPRSFAAERGHYGIVTVLDRWMTGAR